MASVIPNHSIMQQELMRNHLLRELGSWQRSVEFYKQENAFLKYRLSEIVDQTDEERYLKRAELYQNKFLQNDVALEKIQQKIESFIADLHDIDVENSTLGMLRERQDKFRKLFFTYEQGFLELMIEFNEEILKPA